MRRAIAILVTGAALFAAFYFANGWINDRPRPVELPYAERVKVSCDQEYGAESDASRECQATLLIEELGRQRQAQMDRAREGVN